MDIDKTIQELSLQPSDDGYSVKELAEKYGFGIERMRGMVRKLIEQGKMEPIKRPRKNMTGNVTHMTVYGVVSQEVKSKRK